MFINNLYENSKTNKIASIYNGQELSFKELWTKSESIGNYLLKNTEPNKIIGIHGDKENEMLVCMFACIKTRHPYVCLPSYYPIDKINKIIEDCKCEIVINVSSDESIFKDINCKYINFNEIEDDYTKIDGNNYASKDDPIMIIYTSGTTGSPKGIVITYENMLAKTKMAKEFMKSSICDNCRAINLSSYAFSASFSFTYYAMAIEGCTIYCIDRKDMADTKKLCDILLDINPSLLACTPTLIDKLLSDERFNDNYFTDLRYTCLGGEPLHNDIARKYLNNFHHGVLLNGYGTSETTGSPLTYQISLNNINNDFLYLPVGYADNPYSYLIDENGKKISEGKGELIICAKTVSPGYLNNKDLTSKKFYFDHDNNWVYKTGDLMEIKDNRLYFVGRIDNQVKIGGNRIELEDVEANLKKVSIIKNGVAVLQKGTINSIIGFIVLKDEYKDLKGIKAFLKIKEEMKKMVEPHMIPTKFIYLDELPKNINNKIDRALLNKQVNNLK